MDHTQTKPWPPPPDIESIRELVRAADPEGHLVAGAPTDEYEPEEEAILEAIGHLNTSELLTARTLPIIQAVWQKSFNLDQSAMADRRLALIGLAEQIERFFGPQEIPQVRSSTNSL
jgi:hypothetical protein